MNYKEFNDYELLDHIHSCNEDANEILLYKYKPLIVNIATKMIKYSSGGVDLNDLIQEGMLGLNDAINSYDENKEANFTTYSRRYKNKILNESITLEIDNDDFIIDKFLVDNSFNPSRLVENNEFEKETIIKLTEQLTDFEKQVFELKKNDFNYKEIAEILEKDTKAIDNALQRIKIKLKKTMNV